MNSHVTPLKPVKDTQEAERILLRGLEKKQQNSNEKSIEKIEKHIEKDKTICNELEEKEAAQQIDETQEAIFPKKVLPSEALRKGDLKNNVDDWLFTSGISKENISEQEHIEKALSPTNVCKQMKDFVVVVKQMMDKQRKDFSKDTTKFSDGDCINGINFKIPSQVFKEGPITNCEVDKNIEKHIHFITIEADKDIRKVLRETKFSNPNSKSSEDEEEDKILKTVFSGLNGKSLKDKKEDEVLETDFSGSNGKFSKDEKEDEILETECARPNGKSSKDEEEDKILETEFSVSNDKFLKDEKEEEILETDSSKNDQKFLKEEKGNKILKLEFLKDDQSSSKKGKNDKMLKVESLKNDQESSKEGKEDKILKIESKERKDDQGSSKKGKKGKTMKVESLKNVQKLSKGKKGDETLKVESSKNNQEISKEEKGNVTLKTKFVRNDREPLKGEKENKTLKVKSPKNDQEIPERGKDDKTLEIESLNDDQGSSKEKHPKDFKDIKLETYSSISVENSIEEMELSTSICEETKKSVKDVNIMVETQATKHLKDQKSSEKDYLKNVDTKLKIPKEVRFKDQVLNTDIEKYIRNMASTIKTSIDETLKMGAPIFYEKTVKDEKRDEKVKAESLKSDQESSKRGEKEGTIKTKSVGDQESLKRNDQKNLKNVKLEIRSNAESTKKSIEEISLTGVCKNSIGLKQINEMRNVEDIEDDKKALKEDHSKNINNTLKIPNESSKEHAIKDQRLDENCLNKLPQTGDLKDNQESLNEDHPKNINDTKSSNLEQIPIESPVMNFAKNTKESAKAKNTSQETLGTDGKTSKTQKIADSKDSDDASNVNVPSTFPSTSSLVSLKSSLDERPFVLATYLVPSLSIELFEILAEIVEEVINRPVVLIYESRKNRLPSKEIVDMAILPADTEWKDGILLNASFVFKHPLNNNNLPFVYADVIVSTNLPSYVKDIVHLRGHGCIISNKCNKLSAGGLLYEFLRMKGENPSFFGHTTIASSQVAVLEAVARKHMKLGVIDGPVMYCHKFNCCDAEPIQVLHNLGPLPPYRIMLNKYLQDHEIMKSLMTYLLNIHQNKKWMTKLSPYGITGFTENSVSYYSVDDMECVTTNVPYY